jgi:hypothetical protein
MHSPLPSRHGTFPEIPEEPKEKKKMSVPFIGLVQGKTLPRFRSEEFAQSERIRPIRVQLVDASR